MAAAVHLAVVFFSYCYSVSAFFLYEAWQVIQSVGYSHDCLTRSLISRTASADTEASRTRERLKSSRLQFDANSCGKRCALLSEFAVSPLLVPRLCMHAGHGCMQENRKIVPQSAARPLSNPLTRRVRCHDCSQWSAAHCWSWGTRASLFSTDGSTCVVLMCRSFQVDVCRRNWFRQRLLAQLSCRRSVRPSLPNADFSSLSVRTFRPTKAPTTSAWL